MLTPALRLRIDCDALVDNWRFLRAMGGAADCGAAVKADGYGVGARLVVAQLAKAGCRDFFVSNWTEALDVADLGRPITVLHGVRDADMATAMATPGVRPALNSAAQVRRWRDAGGGACDVMVDTGINRLGVSEQEIGEGLLDGLSIDTLMSHLACADDPAHPMNSRQQASLAALRGRTTARRLSLANSAGIALGPDYAFDLTRPGLALYGGVPVPGLADGIAQVVFPEAQILQRRIVRGGETVGYNATWTAPRDTEVAILNIGYADGYWRGFSDTGAASAGEGVRDGTGAPERRKRLPVLGRVSMDLVAIAVDAMPTLREGDWVTLDYALPEAARMSGMSQYELLTGLGARFGDFKVPPTRRSHVRVSSA